MTEIFSFLHFIDEPGTFNEKIQKNVYSQSEAEISKILFYLYLKIV